MSVLTSRETLAEIELLQPGMVRLAELVSLTARVEPALLRHLRREFAPDLGPEVEAELWFGPLAESYGATGFVLDPEFAEILRERLTSRPAQLERLAASMARCRLDAPESIRLEEKVTVLALRDASVQSLEEALRPAVLALSQPERSLDVARWLSRALPRLPAKALRTEAALMLALGASAHFGGRRILENDFDGQLPANAAWAMLTGQLGERVKIGVRLFNTGLEILATGELAPTTIELPATEPLWLEITWKLDSAPYARTVQIYPGRIIDDLPANGTDVRLRTLAGDVYSVEMRTADSGEALQRTISADLTLVQIGVLLTEVERDGLDQGGGGMIPVRLVALIVGTGDRGERANLAKFAPAEGGSSERIILIELSSVGGMESFAPRLRREGVKLISHTAVLVNTGETEAAVCRVNSATVLHELLAEKPSTKVSVFLSYNGGDDEKFRERLVKDLGARDFRVWYDRFMLPKGQSWQSQSADALKESDVVLLILGPKAINSEVVAKEYRMALKIKKPLIPVLFHLDASQVPEELRHIPFINFGDHYDRVSLEQLVQSISSIKTEEKTSPERRAMGLAGVLQSIALPFHVRFRSSEIEPERAKRFWDDFDRRRTLNAKQFDRVREQCEWVIRGMVEEFITPAWTQTPEASPRMTFPNFVEAVATEALELAKAATEPIKFQVHLRPRDVSIYQDLLQGSGLASEQTDGDNFQIVEHEQGSAAMALERFSRELRELLLSTRYDPWSAAPDGRPQDRLPVLATIVSALCHSFLLRRDSKPESHYDAADSVQKYVTPLWQQTRAELLALDTPGFSREMNFREFVGAFNELVARLLDEARQELGDFEMDSYPLDAPAAEEVRRLDPAIGVLTHNDYTFAKAKLSQFIELFRRAATELPHELAQLRYSSTGGAPL
jgi:hypothetical protein